MKQRKVFSPRILIYTEGKHDAKLIKRLQAIYGKNFRIRQGNGSTPEIILNDCVKQIGDFDIRYCVIDGDKIQDIDSFNKKVEQARQKVEYEYKLIVIINYPCIEAIILALLFADATGFDRKNCGVNKQLVKEKMGTFSREGYYEKFLNKSLINENLSLLDGKDFLILLDLFKQV